MATLNLREEPFASYSEIDVAPEMEREGEESLESFWDTLGSWSPGLSKNTAVPRPPAGLPASQPVLRRGSRGSAVKDLQTRLAALGFNPGPVNGAFGSQTEAAVKSLQHWHGIAADGIVGSQTWGQLYAQPGGAQPSPTPGPSAERWVLPADVRAAGEAQYVRYDSPPAWADGANCGRAFMPGAEDLRQHIKRNFRGVTEIGGYACRRNTANTSETSMHGVGRALDIMIPTVGGRANGPVGDPIANWLVRNASSIGIQYIIWNRVSWSGSRSAPKDRSYGGAQPPHRSHPRGAEQRCRRAKNRVVPAIVSRNRHRLGPAARPDNVA